LKAYKFVTKWHRHKKLSSNDPRIEASNGAHENLGDGRHNRDHSLNGFDSFRYYGDGDDPTSPRFYGHHGGGSESCFPTITSLSRNGSRRGRTPSRSSLFIRSLSRRSCDSISSPPGSIYRKSPDSAPSSPPPFLSKSVSGKGGSGRYSTPIMFSNSSGQLIKPMAIEKMLECTLEELFYGCNKTVKITKDVVNNFGQVIQEEEMLTIKVKPGWTKGTRITFEGMGNERPGAPPADVTFIIAEKWHTMFKREGDDLELAVSIPLIKALTGCTIFIPVMGGSDKMCLTIEDIIYPGYEKIISGEGMPNSNEQGQRGDLKINFQVEFPTELTDEQRYDAVSILLDTTC